MTNYNNVKEPYFSAPAAVGDGVADDTLAIQGHLNVAAYLGDRRPLFLPAGRYKTTATIVQPATTEVVGEGTRCSSSEINATRRSSVIQANHTGTAWRLAGLYSSMEKLHFAPATRAAWDTHSVEIIGARHRIFQCSFWRQGLSALYVRGGDGHIDQIEVLARHSNGPIGEDWNHGLWMQSNADGWVRNSSIAAGGIGLVVASNAGQHYSNLKVFNSWQGIMVMGTRMTMFDELRVDEHDNEGIVIDWNSNGNRFSGAVHNCGARVAQPADRRVGLRLASGTHNRFDLTLDNWDHSVPEQLPEIDLRSPMVHGAMVRRYGPASTNRPLPVDNQLQLVCRNMQGQAIVNDEGSANTFL